MLFLGLSYPSVLKNFSHPYYLYKYDLNLFMLHHFPLLQVLKPIKISSPRSLRSRVSLIIFFEAAAAKMLSTFFRAAFLPTHARRQPPHPRPLPRCARSHFCPCFASTPPAAPSLRSLTFVLSISPFTPCFHTPSCFLIFLPANFF